MIHLIKNLKLKSMENISKNYIIPDELLVLKIFRGI